MERGSKARRFGGSDHRAGAEVRIKAKAGSAEARRCSSGEVNCNFIAPAPCKRCPCCTDVDHDIALRS